MKSWEQRPIEVANLFNPAFCGEIIRICVKSYVKETDQAFPYLLTFLVLPIILYDNTRKSMAPDGRRYSFLHHWLQDHPYLRIHFAERVRELIPITQESLTFLFQLRLLHFNENGTLVTLEYKRKKIPDSQKTDPIKDFYHKAEILGKWFARAGDLKTIYIMWGIQP
jgi:hypothetical protein